jgi:UDP-2-acetamido-3-amino-2,3-dideoxy-glucuronate N-acetyltransferase
LEPLKAECQSFLDSIASRRPPPTDGREGLRVLRILSVCQESLESGRPFNLNSGGKGEESKYFVHATAVIDAPCTIGSGTKIWHWSHIMSGTCLGEQCVIGQNCNIAQNVVIGNNVKVQNNVSIYTGTIIEDDVFLGPSCVLTNITNPRSQINRHALFESTLIRRGASIGANATIVCGVELGRYCFVGAGSVVTKNVPDYALVMGNPARQAGWMSRHGHRLEPGPDRILRCPESGFRYHEVQPGKIRCLDLDENAPLPAATTIGTQPYRECNSYPAASL